jgi:hypothetical protein
MRAKQERYLSLSLSPSLPLSLPRPLSISLPLPLFLPPSLPLSLSLDALVHAHSRPSTPWAQKAPHPRRRAPGPLIQARALRVIRVGYLESTDPDDSPTRMGFTDSDGIRVVGQLESTDPDNSPARMGPACAAAGCDGPLPAARGGLAAIRVAGAAAVRRRRERRERGQPRRRLRLGSDSEQLGGPGVAPLGPGLRQRLGSDRDARPDFRPAVARGRWLGSGLGTVTRIGGTSMEAQPRVGSESGPAAAGPSESGSLGNRPGRPGQVHCGGSPPSTG